MTYEQYLDIYQKLTGETTHFMPVVGIKTWPKKILSEAEFSEKYQRLHSLVNQDEAEWMKKHKDDYIDASEVEMWEIFDLRSDLFMLEKLNDHAI